MWPTMQSLPNYVPVTEVNIQIVQENVSLIDIMFGYTHLGMNNVQGFRYRGLYTAAMNLCPPYKQYTHAYDLLWLIRCW